MIEVFSDTGIVTGTTPHFTATLRDGDGNPVGAPALSALTLTLREATTGDVVNSVNEVNILNNGRGTLSVAGALEITFTAADMAAVPTGSRGRQRRIMVIRWQQGTETGAYTAWFDIDSP